MNKVLRVLMLEDSHTDAEIVQQLLSDNPGNCEFLLVMGAEKFISALEEYRPDVVLADNSLPQFDATHALRIVRERKLYIPFILVTGTVSEEFAAGIIKAGADDYILKDRLARLPAAIESAVAKQQIEREKNKALEEIERSNERFQTLSRVTKDAMWDWNLSDDTVWWNESFFSLLGFEQGISAPPASEWANRIHIDDRGRVMDRLRVIRETDVDSWEDEYRFLQPDGSYGAVLERTYIVRDQEGRPIRAMGAMIDITEQKRLRAEMEVLSLVAKETSNGVMIFDRKGCKLNWVNEAFTRITRYLPVDIFDEDLWSILKGPGTDAAQFSMIRQRTESGLPFWCDVLIYDKDGQRKWLYLNGKPLGIDRGEHSQYFMIATDFTERRKMEEERLLSKVERQKEMSRVMLQSQERERNALGRDLHDNVNQILASINLQLAYYLEVPENNMEVIERCRETLLMAITETRNLSHQMVMPGFSDRRLKDELELLLDMYNFSKEVHLDASDFTEGHIPSPIKENLFRIAQEQLSNIVKHAKANIIKVYLKSDDQNVRMDIEDDGIGFDMQRRGHGIGITNIFNRVESYNGSVNLHTEPGKGCILQVTIPLADFNH